MGFLIRITIVHVFTFNATFNEVEQEWRAIEIGNIAGDRTFYEAVFHARIADRLIAAGRPANGKPFRVGQRVARTGREVFQAHPADRASGCETSVKMSAEATALMKRTGMDFDDAWQQVKSEIGVDTRESKSASRLTPGEQIAHWRSEMIEQERESLKPENVRARGNQNLVDKDEGAKLAIDHLFERRSVQRTLHAAGMLLRRGIGRVSVQEAIEFARRDKRPLQTPNFGPS